MSLDHFLKSGKPFSKDFERFGSHIRDILRVKKVKRSILKLFSWHRGTSLQVQYSKLISWPCNQGTPP